MKSTITLLLVAVLCCFGANASAQIITTIAGGDTTGLGDGGPAVDCELNGPYSVALDGLGNFYIPDANNNRIRKVNASGIITTIAGTGVQGFSGDGGPATDAKIYSPAGLKFDRYGDLYFADDFNGRVRKIDTMGIITTVAGGGNSSVSGDGGLATDAGLFSPHDVAIDEFGNIYIAVYGNSCVRKVSTTGIITTIAGTWGVSGNSGDGGPATAAEMEAPYGLTLDAADNLYVADYHAQNIRKIDASGVITTVAGTGGLGYNGDGIAATTAQLRDPCGVSVDGKGNLYIADAENFRIRQVNGAGQINTVAGNGSIGYGGDGGLATLAEIRPTALALDNADDIYIADWGNNRIRFVKNSLSVNSLSNTNDNICIYPNPSDGIFNLNVSTVYDEAVQITVTNLIGEIAEDLTTVSNHPLNIKMNVPPGVYFLAARAGQWAAYKKIEVVR